MKKLNTFVHVVERDQDGTIGRSATFGPADTLPDWAMESITNPDVWDDEPDPTTGDGDSTPAKEPPRGGPGSSAEAWAKFAQSVNLYVPDGASAKEIQAIWDEREV